jgi:hypothetical protein
MRVIAALFPWSALLAAGEPGGLAAVRGVHVEDLGGPDAGSIRDMIIGAVHRTGLFVLTENPEAADAILRGSAEDLIFQNYQRYRESLTARGAASASNRESGESRFNSSSFGVGDSEESSSRERKHEALAAVRLVSRDGTVIWSTTQESDGAKFRGAAADVAERVAEELAKAVREERERAAAARQR